MSRIAATFAALKKQGRKALIPFITAGDPHPSMTVALMHALVAGGADVIELGVPFSDPMADGPVIQRASERALVHGVSLTQVIGFVSEFRQTNDATLVVDYPPEEAQSLVKLLDARSLDTIFLLSPTTRDARLEQVGKLGRGYLYYVSLKGVTGAGHIDTVEVAKRVNQIKKFTNLPVGVGFGIRDAESAKRVAAVADAVVIGSRLVQEIIDAGEDAPARLQALLSGIRAAMDTLTQKTAA
jgi:tryptophan synthase alpha chain